MTCPTEKGIRDQTISTGQILIGIPSCSGLAGWLLGLSDILDLPSSVLIRIHTTGSFFRQRCRILANRVLLTYPTIVHPIESPMWCPGACRYRQCDTRQRESPALGRLIKDGFQEVDHKGAHTTFGLLDRR